MEKAAVKLKGTDGGALLKLVSNTTIPGFIVPVRWSGNIKNISAGYLQGWYISHGRAMIESTTRQ